ncbi:Cbb3-type cytochrome oxidase, subunit 3 (fragment) [Sterolibacterium denitrificans]|uniref:Cbb3-type cytochrome oxidase, subunit 3 n=1 Tax=Sterolibacterium denitrificans TaxID=157592 RepID=A0A7Z7HRM9_9PROT
MDTNDLRAALTVLMLLIFVGIVWWSYSGKRRQAFDEAAQLPFTEEDDSGPEPGNRR